MPGAVSIICQFAGTAGEGAVPEALFAVLAGAPTSRSGLALQVTAVAAHTLDLDGYPVLLEATSAIYDGVLVIR